MKTFHLISIFFASVLLMTVISCSTDHDELDNNINNSDARIETRADGDDGPGPGPVRLTFAYHYKAKCYSEGGGSDEVDSYFKTAEECRCFRRVWSGKNCTIDRFGAWRVDFDCVRKEYRGPLYNYLCP